MNDREKSHNEISLTYSFFRNKHVHRDVEAEPSLSARIHISFVKLPLDSTHAVAIGHFPGLDDLLRLFSFRSIH